MLRFPTKNLFIEGPDCSGKTTLVKKIHEITEYKWHVHDRSQISRKIFKEMYGRNLPFSDSDLSMEVSDLNNRYILLVPDPDLILERFKERGDEIHSSKSIIDVWSRFSEASEKYFSFPNVLVYYSGDANAVSVNAAASINLVESSCLKSVSDYVKEFVKSTDSLESYPLQFTLFDDGEFEEASVNCMDYDLETEYYQEIYERFHNKIKRELSGQNEYNRKESFSSRRFVYADDRCISFIQCAIRERQMDFNVVIRSSDVENTFEHDLKFLYYLASTCYSVFEEHCDSVRMRFNLNSAHFVQ